MNTSVQMPADAQFSENGNFLTWEDGFSCSLTKDDETGFYRVALLNMDGVRVWSHPHALGVEQAVLAACIAHDVYTVAHQHGKEALFLDITKYLSTQSRKA